MPLQLSTPVKFVKRIGDRIATGLADRGISTIEDLLYHLPFRYEDRLHPKPLSLYQPGDMASLLGEVRGTALLRTRSGPIFEMTVGITPPDPNSEAALQGLLAPPPTFLTSGFSSPPTDLSSRPKRSEVERPAGLYNQPILETVKCMWFHGTYLKDKFHPGQKIALYGKLEGSRSGNALHAPPGSTRFKMIQPTFEILPDSNATGDDAEFTMLEMGRIVPVYESLGGKTPWGSKLTSRWLRRVMWTIFKDLAESSTAESSTAESSTAESSTAESATAESTTAKSATAKSATAESATAKSATAKSATAKSATAESATAESATLDSPVILSEARSAKSKDPEAASHPHSPQPLSATQSPASSAQDTLRQESAQNSLRQQQVPRGFSLGSHSPEKKGASAPEVRSQEPPPSAQHDTLPTALRNRLTFPTRMDALRDLHFPPAGTSITELMSARTPAHRRLIFEEFFYLELGLELKRRKLRNRQGTAFVTNDQVREALKQILPFKPTAAQKRVLGEIIHDMRRTQPMRRLLQGDVGSGKTIVAFQAALVAIENGYQVALMAPTEILATQHYLSARKLLSEKISPRTQRPYRIALLTGSLDDRTKRDTRARILRGEVDLAIGTHALVEANVDFANLGLVIVDEQHRFGVQQRFQLTRKPNSGTGATPPLEPTPTAVILTEAQPPLNSVISTEAQPPLNSVIPTEASASHKSVISTEAKRSGEIPVFLSDHPNSVILSAARSAQPKDLQPRSPQHSPPPLSGTQSPPPSAQDPDVLVMTATPIPRTLALTLYGDLEASVIDELPPGRTPIQTRRMPEERSDEVWDFVRKQVTAGRQAYIVYPIIEGNNDDQPELDFAKFDEEQSSSIPAPTLSSRPKQPTLYLSSRPKQPTPYLSSRPKRSAVERPAASARTTTKSIASKRNPLRTKLRSATEMHAELQQGPLHGLKLGLLHGRMSADDKEITMARFKRGELDILVSTTVIEVGVDVPNATVMVIEHADRFGLAQLHQLRGRVGRGAAKSFCILVTNSEITPEAELRLNAMVQTQDGFALAELDLQQRGPGEFFGTRQAGLPDLRVANLARDRDLLELARLEAARFAEQEDPTIPRPEIEAVWSRLKQQWQRRYGLVEA